MEIAEVWRRKNTVGEVSSVVFSRTRVLDWGTFSEWRVGMHEWENPSLTIVCERKELFSVSSCFIHPPQPDSDRLPARSDAFYLWTFPLTWLLPKQCLRMKLKPPGILLNWNPDRLNNPFFISSTYNKYLKHRLWFNGLSCPWILAEN